MNKKQYTIARLIIMVLLTISIIISISMSNYYLPIVFLFTAFVFMYYFKKQLKTKDVLADERDYKIAGDTARYSIFIYAFIATITMFVLMGISQNQGELYAVSLCLAFSVCFLLILNSFLFKFLSKKGK